MSSRPCNASFTENEPSFVVYLNETVEHHEICHQQVPTEVPRQGLAIQPTQCLIHRPLVQYPSRPPCAALLLHGCARSPPSAFPSRPEMRHKRSHPRHMHLQLPARHQIFNRTHVLTRHDHTQRVSPGNHQLFGLTQPRNQNIILNMLHAELSFFAANFADLSPQPRLHEAHPRAEPPVDPQGLALSTQYAGGPTDRRFTRSAKPKPVWPSHWRGPPNHRLKRG